LSFRTAKRRRKIFAPFFSHHWLTQSLNQNHTISIGKIPNAQPALRRVLRGDWLAY
jgi:hypothetical protein